MANDTQYWPDRTTLRSKLVDNGDGTGVLTKYNDQGEEISTEDVSGLDIPDPDPELSDAERIDLLEELIANLTEEP